MRLYADIPTGAVPRARLLRRDATAAEKVLWRALREAFPPIRFRRQVPVGPYFVDFLSFGARLIVEVDGGQHAEAVEYDARRTRFLEAQGYRVLRFWNNDVLENLEGVIETIAKSLSLWEREGAAQRRKGEAVSPTQQTCPPSPSHDASHRGPLPLPMGEGSWREGR